MPTNTRVESNMHVVGRITAEAMTLPDSTVTDAMVASNAAIAASKVVHRFPIRHSQNEGAVVADEVMPIHIARAAGTVKAIEVVVTNAVPVGDSTVTVDLKKGNAASAYASVLSSVITLDNATVLRTAVAGTINTSAYAAGDSFLLDINATVGTGTLPTGIVVTVFFEESPS